MRPAGPTRPMLRITRELFITSTATTSRGTQRDIEAKLLAPRPTADYRANALPPPDQQNNRKVALDEGTCDYWAATMLGTPHIWAWHLRHDEQVTHPRSLSSSKTMADFVASPTADAHANGTIW